MTEIMLSVAYGADRSRAKQVYERKAEVLLGRVLKVLILLYFALSAGLVQAAEVVALGASNTYGEGLQRGEDYPSQLEHLLRVKGLPVSVKNAGINGNTSQELLDRVESVLDADTKVVVLQVYRYNDERHDVPVADTKAHITEILAKLRLHRIKPIVISIDEIRSLPRQMDGIHLTAEGQLTLAKRVLPRVVAALRH